MSTARVGLGIAGLVLMLALAGYFLAPPPAPPGPLGPVPGPVTAPARGETASAAATPPTPPPGGVPAPARNPVPERGDNDNDRWPEQKFGSVRVSFRLPADSVAYDGMTLDCVVPGPEPHSGARGRFRAPARTEGGGTYTAVLATVAEGELAFWADIAGLGTAGLQRVTVVEGETLEVDLGELRPVGQLTLRTEGEGPVSNVSGTLALDAVHAVEMAFSRTIRRRFAGVDDLGPVPCLPGEYFLRFEPAAGAPVFRRIQIASGVQSQSIRLESAATLSVEVQNSSGDPQVVWLRFTGEGDVFFDWKPGRGETRESIVTLGGRAEIDHMPTGRWSVLAGLGSGGPFTLLGVVLLEPGKTTERTFTYRE